MESQQTSRTCTRCGTVYPPELVPANFRVDRVRKDASFRRSTVCEPCKHARRTEIRRHDRPRQKVRDTRNRHAQRLGKSIEQLETVYGWTEAKMTHDIALAAMGKCVNCNEPYRGLEEVTLDITNPGALPFYGVNTRWICAPCNRAKGQKTGEEYEALQAGYRLRAITLTLRSTLICSWCSNGRAAAAPFCGHKGKSA